MFGKKKAEVIWSGSDIRMKELLDSNEIIKIGGGRYTSYTWNWEK